MRSGKGLSVSIVIPSFNQAQYVERTLDSIFSQSYPAYEVIVVDGASSDGTVDILQRYAEQHPSLSWISEPDSGPADAVNKGLKLVRGDIVGIQSSDDIYLPDAFAHVADVFAASDDCGFVFGDVAGIDANDNLLYERRYKGSSWAELFAVSMCIPQSSIFFRRALIAKVGYWDAAYYGCDLEYWMRLMFHTKAEHLPEVLSGWRIYPGQRTRPDQCQRIWDDYWRMIDTSEELKYAPRKIQRWAKASRHLLVLRFSPDRTLRFHLPHLAKAFLLHPGYVWFNPWRTLVYQLLLSSKIDSIYQLLKKFVQKNRRSKLLGGGIDH